MTWVLAGSLTHSDAAGRHEVLRAGDVQRLSAGSGVRHSERNEAAEPLRFIQSWLAPDAPGGEPDYERAAPDPARLSGRLAPVAAGRRWAGEAVVGIGTASAALLVGRLDAGERVSLPGAPYVLLLVAVGSVELERAGRLSEGDAVRASSTGSLALRATSPAEVLVWEMHDGSR